MTGEMIYAVGNEHVLVNVKRRCDALRKDVGNVVIGVRAVVELGAEGTLPFLGGDLAERIWSMQKKSFESVLWTKPTSGLKLGPVFLRSTKPSSQFER